MRIILHDVNNAGGNEHQGVQEATIDSAQLQRSRNFAECHGNWVAAPTGQDFDGGGAFDAADIQALQVFKAGDGFFNRSNIHEAVAGVTQNFNVLGFGSGTERLAPNRRG